MSFVPEEWTLLPGFGGPILANGAEDCRRAVRRVLRLGADFIKTCNSGGSFVHERASSSARNGPWRSFGRSARRLTARASGSAVHAHLPAHIREAVEAGADTIEHGTWSTSRAPVSWPSAASS